MRPFLLLLLTVLAPLHAVRAQETSPLRRPALGTFDVVALMVEFQPDTSRFSTGTGTFDGPLFENLEPRVDPLPHDHAYFEAHLEFLRNYVRRVSDGRASVRTHLLPEVVRVSQPMAAYAPTGPNADAPEQRARLARLIEEAWTLADDQVSFDPSTVDPGRTAYVIFHAGVGRDIELTGTTLDRTPEDLPSLYFGPATLDALLPGANIVFKGLRVDQSLILPRTETRRGVDFVSDEPFLIEISINGMLAASFFNYLGVPDLFDTASGRSAIGPFGLMDPLGIFAYGGLFPPEPSAWTRYFLGWANPLDVRGEDSLLVTLPTSSAFGSDDMARVWVSEREYFLVENRQRDPQSDGLRLTIWRDGSYHTATFQHAQEGFSGPDISAFPGGVVVDVDNYDWALPGGVDEEGRVLQGGILIWHVDERTVEDGLLSNSVNTNPLRRGVDLEEADGAQDIGFPSENPFAPQADLGSPFDFWYEGNPVRVVNQAGQEIALYQNRFGPDTHPSSDAAAGGFSFVELDRFSATGNEMTFTYRRASPDSPRPIELPFADALQRAIEAEGVPTGVSIWEQQRHLVVSVSFEAEKWLVGVGDPDGGLEVFDALTPASQLRERLVWVQREGEGLAFVRYDPVSGILDRTTMPGSARARIAGAVVTYSDPSVLAQIDGGATVFMLRGEEVERLDVPDIGAPIGLTLRGLRDEAAGLIAYGRLGAAAVEGTRSWSYTIAAGEPTGRPVSGEDAGGFLGVVPLPERGTLLVLQPDGVVEEVPAGTSGLSEVSLADVTGDSHLEIFSGGDSLLYALTRSGAVAAGFPISLEGRMVEAPALATGHIGPIVFAPMDTGVADAYEKDAGGRFRRIVGYPIPIGAETVAVVLVSSTTMSSGTGHVYALSRNGRLYGWVQSLSGYLWPGPYAGANHVSLALQPNHGVPSPASRLLVPDETYNWPNPIRSGGTHLRCMTQEDSRVVITIIDGAGTFVDELTLESVRAGVASEVRWETNAPSGLYFARVRATSTTGREDTHLIKMAVIR